MLDIQIASGVVIRDISNILLTHPKKNYKGRTKQIKTLFVHHSGADNKKDNAQAFAAMAGYHVINKQWPAIAYHYGITLRPSLDVQGNYIIYQLNNESNVCYHTKGCNDTGIGLVLQGHHGEELLSDFQIECLEAFLPWWAEKHNRDLFLDLGWHSCSIKWGGIPKPACPGKYAVKWLKEYKSLL